MRNPTELVLKAFLSRRPAEQREALTRFLPEKEQERLALLPAFPEEPPTEGHGRVVDLVHWSWFLPTLKTYGPREQRLFLSSVHSRAARNLGHILNNQPTEEISEIGKKFLREMLLNSLIGPKGRVVPIDYLPPSRLNELLDLSKKELTSLVDRLSLYDLKAELRQTVETKTLKKLYGFLTPREKKWLQQLAERSDSTSLGRLGLERWDGTEEAFRLLLHRKGLSRLATGLTGQDPDLIWYVCHQLDISRGNLLFKLCQKEANPMAAEAVINRLRRSCMKQSKKSGKLLALLHTEVRLAPGEKILPKKEFATLVKAADVLKQAKREAQEEADRIREEAFNEGFQKGLDKWNHQLMAINAELKELREDIQKKILPLAIKAGRKILGEELKLHPDRIVDIVMNSLKPVTQHKKIVIYVNKEDLGPLEKNKAKIRKIFEHLESLSIQEREDVEAGGCMIETEAGIINAQLENQWRALESAFESFNRK